MFSGHLDPRAQEFRPRNPSLQNQITLLQPHIYYPYPSSLYPSTGVQVLPFYDVGVGYQPSQSTAYVRLSGAPLPPPPPPPPPPQLPPPSPTATRALLLSSVPTDVTESTVRRELEVLGEIRAVEMESLQDGIVTVHFYDLRHAEAAMMAIREQHMQQQRRMRHLYNAVLRRAWTGFESENLALTVPVPSPGSGLIAGQAVWAQFMLPTVIPVSDGHNQGTLVVFNLDSGVSASKLREIFEAFGPVKELRETPSKQHQRFVEFFDIRDAARAIKEMEGKEIHGKRVLIEFSRPGGNRRRFSNTVTTYSNLNSLSTTTTTTNSRSNYYSRITNYSIPPPPPILPPKSFRRSTSDASSSNSSLIPQSKKSSFIRGNGTFNNTKRLNCGGTMGTLSMSIVGNLKNNNCASATKQQQQGKQLRNNSRSWKGNRNKNSDSHFLIKEDEMMEESKCIKDTRTTVMIKNIPNKYSQKLLLNMLDNHCNHCNQQIADGDDDQPLSTYDFVYLPIDFNNKCNVGYGFVNLTSPQATWRFYKAFHLQRWEVFNSRKICEVTYARLQGLEVLMEHFKNSKFACETDEYLPVVFSPPRDGKQLTDPVAIGGHTNVINKKQLVIGSGAVGGFDGEDDDEVEDEMDGQDWLHGCNDDEDQDEVEDDDDDGESSNGGDVNDDEDGVPRVPKDQLE